MRTLLLSILCLTACDTYADIERYDADTLTGRRGRKLEIRYLDGQRTTFFGHDDAGLEITVERSINDYDEERVELVIVIESSYPDELRATVEDLYIDYRGKRYRGFNTRWGWRKNSKENPSIPPREKKRFCWAFPLFIRPEAGIYTVGVTNVRRVVGGVEQAFGEDITFTLPVPGPKTGPLVEYH